MSAVPRRSTRQCVSTGAGSPTRSSRLRSPPAGRPKLNITRCRRWISTAPPSASPFPRCKGPTMAATPPATPAKKAKPMAKKQLAHFEKRLLEERKRVLKELGHHGETFGSTPMGAAGELTAYSFHMADQGTDA